MAILSNDIFITQLVMTIKLAHGPFQIMNSKEEELTFFCSLYLRWEKTSSSWKSVTEGNGSRKSLSLLMNPSKDKHDSDNNPGFAILVVTSGQDVLQRIRYLLGTKRNLS